MKEDETRKLREASKPHEESRASDESPETEERARNADVWSRDGGAVSRKETTESSEKVRAQERGERKPGADKGKAEVPSAESLAHRLEDAWSRREEPDRFSTEGKTAVLYSGLSESSKHRSESLDKREGDLIHSGELAAHHTQHNPDTHIKLEETYGGRELEQIQTEIKSSGISGVEREALDQQMKGLWEDASDRFSKAARENVASVAYVEKAKPDAVYTRIERPNLRQAADHISLSDAPLNDGKPPLQDQIPEQPFMRDGKIHTGLDKDGRYHADEDR